MLVTVNIPVVKLCCLMILYPWIVMWCVLDICSTSTLFILLSDLFDTISLDNCEQVFSFVEERVSLWKLVSSRTTQSSNNHYQIKSNQITLLATAPLICSTGVQVQAYNYNANTIIPMNNKSLKKLKNP